nr:hypothetical protein [Escherichia coli]
MSSTKDSACVKDRCVELAARSRAFHAYLLRETTTVENTGR